MVYSWFKSISISNKARIRNKGKIPLDIYSIRRPIDIYSQNGRSFKPLQVYLRLYYQRGFDNASFDKLYEYDYG